MKLRTLVPVVVAATSLAMSLAMLAVPARAQRGRATSRIDTTFVFDKNGDVALALVNGEVRVTAWTRNEARVIAATSQGPFTSTLNAGRIRLGLSSRAIRGGSTTYDITVPIGVRVTVSTVSGAISVSGTRGDVKLNSVSGTVDARDVAGHAEISAMSGHVVVQRSEGTTSVSTVGGSVTISEVTGDLDIGSVGGSARIEGDDVRSLRYHTVAGNLDFTGKLSPQGRHSIETFSGSVTLHVPADFGATLAFETFSGRLRPVDFPVTLQPNGDGRRAKDRQEIVLNDGAIHIGIQTFSGDVFLRKLDAPTTRR